MNNMKKKFVLPQAVRDAQQFFRDARILREDENWTKEDEWKYIRNHFDIVVNAFNALVEIAEEIAHSTKSTDDDRKSSSKTGYADKLEGEDRIVLEMRPGITGPATLKYRNEEKLIDDYVHQQKASGDPRSEDEIAQWYNDEVIYPDKVRINKEYYYRYSFVKDLKILWKTVF